MDRGILQTHLDTVEVNLLKIAATVKLWEHVGVLPARYIHQLQAMQGDMDAALVALLTSKQELGLNTHLSMPEEA